MAEGTQHPITDAGRRMSEAYREARSRGGEGRWLAVSLADGSTTGDIYDSRADAVRHTREDHTAYVCMAPMDMPPAEATAWIDLHRKLWRGGFRFTDPGAPMPIPDLGPMATAPRGARPSGLLLPNRRDRRGGHYSRNWRPKS
jgi:hypothetical protein